MSASVKNSRRPWFKKSHPQVNPKLATSAANFDHNPKYGYHGFSLYFPEETKIEVKPTIKRVSAFEKFIENNNTLFTLSSIEAQKFFTIDYKQVIANYEQLVDDWENLKTQIINDTEYCLGCMGLAMHQTIVNHGGDEEVGKKKYIGVVRARLINVEPVQQIKDIRVNCFGKLVSVRGTVIKVSSVRVILQHMAFSCSTCTGIQVYKQNEGVFATPKKCTTEGCKAQSNFNPLWSSLYTITNNFQLIKIQEIIGTDEFESGRVPRTLECELTEDMVNSCVPGDDISICGVTKVRNNMDKFQKSKQSSAFVLYVDVLSVINTKNQTHGSCGASEPFTFNITDYYAIQKIHAEPQLFRFLVQSLCPNIYGHEMVKAGLALALLGGTKSGKTRAESHILMVGDPGLGKSQMLQACTNVAPRGVYVCGNTSTGSGLTVTMHRESGGDYSFEAGALMLADKGCCCIDEFDKMPTQHACLLEAMEQQTISIAKAGIVCSLPARAAILAAANPAGGHYNKAKTIVENLKISSPMLSRFDLIFILLDQPNEERDMLLSKHVLAQHAGKNLSGSLLNTSLAAAPDDTLRGRLSLQNCEAVDYLPHILFRKYIAYAHKYVNPRLSAGAKETLRNFYIQLRKQYQSGECTPVTRRQLKSLIRLTQARAKIELREEATTEDASDVIEVMKESLMDIFTNEIGILDKTRSQSGTGMSTKNQLVKLLKLMQQKSEDQAKSIFTINELREMSGDAGICKTKFRNVLDQLNIQGFILNKGYGRYQLVTAEL